MTRDDRNGIYVPRGIVEFERGLCVLSCISNEFVVKRKKAI